MKHIFILPAFAFSLSASAQKPAPNRFAGLDTAFARVLKNWQVPGFAVAVVEKYKVVYSKGFGYADYEVKTPVTPNTVFAIASCTKAFTAGLLGILNKEGKVDFDKPVRTYLPSFSFYNAEMNNGVTLRDMMCHRTGLPRHDLTCFFPTQSRDSLVQRIQYMQPSAPLRQKWQYNNLMYVLQGVVIEKLTGKSWEENIQSSFFQPLGMTRSTVRYADWMKTDSIAKGYGLKDDRIIRRLDYYNNDVSGADGSINSSVNDMAKWLMMWIHGGRYNDREILPAGYVKEAVSSQMVMDGALPAAGNTDLYFANYGLGWAMTSYRGHYRVEHDGNIDGFSSVVTFFPADSIGIVVLCNQGESDAPFAVRNLMADKLLQLPYTDWNGKIRKQYETNRQAEQEALSAKQINISERHPATHPPADYTGLYLNKGYGKIQIRLSGDSLIATNMLHPVYYRHETYDLFSALTLYNDGYDTVHVMPIHFLMDDNGNISSLSAPLEPNVDPIIFTRIPEEKPAPAGIIRK